MCACLYIISSLSSSYHEIKMKGPKKQQQLERRAYTQNNISSKIYHQLLQSIIKSNLNTNTHTWDEETCLAPFMPSKEVAKPIGKLLIWHSGSQASNSHLHFTHTHTHNHTNIYNILCIHTCIIASPKLQTI